jgi:integrase
MSVPSRAPGERTSSAHLALVDEAIAPVEEADGVAGVERTTSLDGAELLPQAAPVSGAEPRTDVTNVELLPALASVLSDPFLELRSGDVAEGLVGLPASARAAVADVEWFSRVYEQAAKTKTTRRLYLNRLTLFLSWCAARGVGAMPAHPEVLRLYLVSLAAEHKALSTLDVSLAAISMAHRALGHDPPMSEGLRATLRLLRITLGPRSTRPTPISLAMLRQIVTPCGQDPLAIRDRALILVTYFAGLGRLEAAGLNREEAHREERGYRLTLGRTKSDRTDAPARRALQAELDLCPVRALDGWLVVRAMWARGPDLSPTRGPLFVALHRGRRERFRIGDRLAPSDVDRIVKRRASAAGLNPVGLSAVSLRAGFYAEAARSDASPEEIREHVEFEATPRFLRAAEAVAPLPPTRSPT